MEGHAPKAPAGRIPTWAVVLATGMGLVFYAQREFVPRSEARLIEQQDHELRGKLESADEKLGQRIAEVTALIERSNEKMLDALDRHAMQAMHPGTAEQFVVIHSALVALQNGQRAQYAGMTALLQQQKLPVPPPIEYPILPLPQFQQQPQPFSQRNPR